MIPFYSNQVKSADAVTRDNAGNIIPLIDRFNEASNDIRFSSVNEKSPDSLTFTDSSGSIESKVVNADDNGRVRKVSSRESERNGIDGRKHTTSSGASQEGKEWRNLPRAVQKSIQKEVSEYIGNSPNYDEAIMYILDGTGKTIDDISIEEYNAQIKKTAATLYETAMQSRVLAENKFKYLGSDGISKLIDRIISNARNGSTIINKVRTIHARGNADINDNNILYINEDKKRTQNWFQVCGISVPLEGTKFGLIRSIAYADGKNKQNLSTVNREGEQLSESQREYFADSKVRDENGNLNPTESNDLRYSRVNHSEESHPGQKFSNVTEISSEGLTSDGSNGSIESEVMNANDNERVRGLSSEISGANGNNGSGHSETSGMAQDAKAWGNLSRKVQNQIYKEVSNYIGESSNYDEIMLFVLGKIGKTIDTVSASEYKKQITETARELYETAIKSKVLAENKFGYLGSDGISRLINRVLSKADEQKFSRVNLSEETKAAIEAYRAQTTVEAKAMKAVYEAERKQIVDAYKKQEHPKGCPCFCLILVINLSTVSRIHDNYHKFPIIDSINNAICTYPQPIKGIMSLQFFISPSSGSLRRASAIRFLSGMGSPSINFFACFLTTSRYAIRQAPNPAHTRQVYKQYLCPGQGRSNSFDRAVRRKHRPPLHLRSGLAEKQVHIQFCRPEQHSEDAHTFPFHSWLSLHHDRKNISTERSINACAVLLTVLLE